MAQLDVEGVTLTFGGVAALSGVSMRVEAGELVSIIGPNGAGKTSLLNCISGFYHPERGRILFEGQDLTRASPHEVTRKGIARAFQNIELFSGLTVLENLLLARHTHLSYGLLQAGLFYGRALAEEVRNRRVVEEVIDFMELEPYRKALVGNLPYGVRKRVEVAPGPGPFPQAPPPGRAHGRDDPGGEGGHGALHPGDPGPGHHRGPH